MTLTCKECGKVETLVWRSEYNEDLASKSLCFTCNHWLNYVPESSTNIGLKLFTYQNKCYVIDHPIPLEIGEHKYVITFNNGTRVETNKINCFGEVPDNMQSRYPENAVLEKVV